MGRKTYTDIVPFIVHGAFEMDSWGANTEESDWALLISAERPSDWPSVETIGPFRGWVWADLDERLVGKRGRLYGHLWQKDGHEVWLINESEYSNVGDYDMAIVANDRASLEAFILDWGNDMSSKDIDEMDTCKQTL